METSREIKRKEILRQDKLIAVRRVKSFLFGHFMFLLLFQWYFLMLRKLLCSSYQLRRCDRERAEEERERERDRARVNKEGGGTLMQVALLRRLIMLLLGDRKFRTLKTV